MASKIKGRRRKPKFIRAGGARKKSLGEKWRKPRGTDSKMRVSIFGKPKRPKAGYGTHRAVRGIHPSGYVEVRVTNPDDLDQIDPSRQAARIASGVGLKKREEILQRAGELGIKVLNG